MRFSLGFLFFALCQSAIGCSGRPAPHGSGWARQILSRNDFDWATAPFAYGHVHALRGSYSAHHVDQFIGPMLSARDSVLRMLQLADTSRDVEIFLVDDRDQMARVVGRPIAGMVQQGERSAIFVFNDHYRPFLHHELTHLYSLADWGIPPTGRWVSEALASLATGSCQGHSIDEIVAGFDAVPWHELRDNFERLPEMIGYQEGASVLQFIHQRDGIAGVHRVWDGDTSYFALEPQWRAHLRSVKPAQLDTARLKNNGC